MSSDIFVVVEHNRGQVSEISYSMLAAARSLVEATGGEAVAVLLGQGAQGLADDLAADRVLYMDHPILAEFTPDGYQQAVASLIESQAPRAVFFGDTTVGADVAAVVSARLGLPMVSYCRSVEADGGALRYVSQICGGKIMAEGELPGPTALVTMLPGAFKPEDGRAASPPEVEQVVAPELAEPRVRHVRYIEPDVGDVDITRASVLVAVGRGVQTEDNIELAEELAEALGGAVCASRPVVDQGWLSTARLVGKSGKSVSPKVYFALGISGAPEHTESITSSDVIIAVNTDPAAPIFDIAQYGAEMDMLDLLEALNEQLQAVKGG
jgi:electron transfer flavoprotein alpha subunit